MEAPDEEDEDDGRREKRERGRLGGVKAVNIGLKGDEVVVHREAIFNTLFVS